MSRTLGQLVTTTYALLREDPTADVPGEVANTHFEDPAIIKGFVNEAVEFAAVFIEYPRDLVSVQAESGIGSYPNPSDNLVVRTAYFGNRDTIQGDIRPLTIVSEETLKSIHPSWMDQTAGAAADRPEYLIQLDRKTVYVYPRPNDIGSQPGKKIWLNYNYVPQPMVEDTEVPDLPAPYHPILPFYALHLCYIALQKMDLAEAMYKDFMGKVNLLKSAVTKETKEGLGFSWAQDQIQIDGSTGGITL